MAARSLQSRYCRSILATCLLSMTLHDVTTAMTSSSSSSSSGYWKREDQRTVTSVVLMTAARSRLECAQQCQQRGGCDSVVFDAASSTCNLQPSHRAIAQGDAGSPVSVLTAVNVKRCNAGDAPVIPNGQLSSWRMTESTLENDGSCHEDYIASEDGKPLLQCQEESGSWTMPATCVQRAWRDNTVQQGESHSLPRSSALVGWCMRTKGHPTKNTWFVFNLGTSDEDIVMHFNPRLNHAGYRRTVVNNLRNGAWGSEIGLQDPSPPFPFSVGVSFEMTITAISLYQLKVQVDDADYYTYNTAQPVSDITSVTFGLDVEIEYLNTWC